MMVGWIGDEIWMKKFVFVVERKNKKNEKFVLEKREKKIEFFFKIVLCVCVCVFFFGRKKIETGLDWVGLDGGRDERREKK